MRNISLRKVTPKNMDALCRMQVADAQKSFVAKNVSSLAEAYVAITNGDVALPFGIYADEDPVGFLMIGYNALAEDDFPPTAHGYGLWRFMIAEEHQRQGYGREAVRQALDYIRSFPVGEAAYCWLAYEPENQVAKALYESFGFRESGDRIGREFVSVLQL